MKMRLILVLVGAVAFTGCSAKQNQAVVTANTALHDGLIAFDNALDSRCDSGVLTPETCKSINTMLVPVWDLKNEINRLSRDRNVAGIATRVETFVGLVDKLISTVRETIKDGALVDMLVRELNLAKTQSASIQ